MLIASVLKGQVPPTVSYQGLIVANGVSFHGTGHFKFVILNDAGTISLWSNDSTSTGGSQPSAAVSLPVTEGVFSVLLGDTSVSNMASIPKNVWNNPGLRLRIWFNNGTDGFTPLSPDQHIHSTPYAIKAGSIDDGAVTTAKIADGAVTGDKIAAGAVDSSRLSTSVQVSFMPPGMVVAYAGNTAPSGWAMCDGAAISRTGFASLYAVIGTNHGSGDGSTTFNLPDYRGLFLRGVDGGTGRDPDAAGRTAMAPGGNVGSAIGSVQADEFKAHSHTLSFDNVNDNNASHRVVADVREPNFHNAEPGGSETRPKNATVNFIIKL